MDTAGTTWRHLVLHSDPGPAPEVEQVDPVRLHLLRLAVDPLQWWGSGVADALIEGCEAVASWGATGEPARPWIPALLGGATLTRFAGARRHVSVLVAADARGQGIGTALARTAASYAVQWHGWAHARCFADDESALRIAARLGFETYATTRRIGPDAEVRRSG